MGFHTCPYCQQATSSGDVTLNFSSGNSWVMPDMVTHYVQEHNWQPPALFIQDVMESQISTSERRQTRSGRPLEITPVGYLDGEFKTGSVPMQFLEKLVKVLEQASNNGYRAQSKGLNNLR